MIPIHKILEHSNPWENRPWENPNDPVHDDAILRYALEGWTAPIEIDVGCPSFGCWVEWIIWDGNHRVCAAILRGDKEIAANISGELGYASEIFGVVEEEMWIKEGDS